MLACYLIIAVLSAKMHVFLRDGGGIDFLLGGPTGNRYSGSVRTDRGMGTPLHTSPTSTEQLFVFQARYEVKGQSQKQSSIFVLLSPLFFPSPPHHCTVQHVRLHVKAQEL